MRKLTGLITLAAICSAAASATADPVRGGTLVFARNADSQFLDPVLNNANVDIWVSTNLNSNLLLPTNDAQHVRPGIATSYAVTPDGKRMTLKLRPAKFADGSPVTADDVIWSLTRASNQNNGEFAFLLASIDKVSAPAADTIQIDLKHPDPSLPSALATFNAAIMPHKLFEASPGKNDDEKAHSFAEHPIGAGPFVLSAWQRGSKMVLKRNPYYWELAPDGKPLPYLDEVDMTIVPDDATRILQLKGGQIDVAEFIPYERVKELQADPDLAMDLFPSTKIDYLQLNARPKLKDGTDNPLSNLLVRQALNYAINKQALIAITTHGLGTPMQSLIPSTTPLYYGAGPAYPYDLAKAKALLEQAGYAKGFPLSIMIQSGKADDTSNVSAIQQMWSQLGVKLSIEQHDETTEDDLFHAAKYQIRAGYWTNDIADPNEITGYCAYSPQNEAEYSGWQSKQLDALFEASQVEQDPAKRAEQYKQIQIIFVQQAPIFFMYETPFAAATRKQVKGFFQLPLGNDVFDLAYIEK
jgi:peptide/nickel transport system substrate-binding protein